MAQINDLKAYYNKFNEDKRLLSRHGQVEFTVTMHYIKTYLKQFAAPKIMEIGAGTGRYAVALADSGYDVTAVELLKNNLGTLKAKKSTVKAYLGNALDLQKFKSDSFDLTLLLGPMYHLATEEEKMQALNEAKRITKKDGYLFVAYLLNDYAVITYGFKAGHIALLKEACDDTYKIGDHPENLYSYYRLEDIDLLNKECDLKRVKIIAPDGHSDYMRPVLNKMTAEEFAVFLDYQLKTCERKELLGMSSHALDILQK